MAINMDEQQGIPNPFLYRNDQNMNYLKKLRANEIFRSFYYPPSLAKK